MIVVVEEDLLLRPSICSTLERYADNVGDESNSSSGIMRKQKGSSERSSTTSSSSQGSSSSSSSLSALSIPSFIKHKNSAGNKKNKRRIQRSNTAEIETAQLQKLFYKYTGKKREDIDSTDGEAADGAKELLIVDEDDHNKVILLPQAQHSNSKGKKNGVKTFASPSNTIKHIKRALSREPTQNRGGDNRKKATPLTTAERIRMVDLLLLDPQQRAILHLTSLPSSSCTPSEMEALI